MNITSVKVDIRREKVDIGLATDLLNTCYSSPEASLIFCVKESPVAVQTKSENIFEKLFRKFLSIGSPAGKCWNKTKFPCKKCTDAPIIRREKWQTRKVDRTNNSFIQLRVFFSRIHKKSAYRHYVGTPIYDNLEAEYGALRLSHTEDMRPSYHSVSCEVQIDNCCFVSYNIYNNVGSRKIERERRENKNAKKAGCKHKTRTI